MLHEFHLDKKEEEEAEAEAEAGLDSVSHPTQKSRKAHTKQEPSK